VSGTILQRIVAGDMAAMQECIDHYGGLVWSLARRLSLSPAEAEDGVQEVFIELWKHADRFDPEVAAEATFVGMIARRRLIDRRRSRMAQQRHVKTTSEMPEPSLTPSESGVDLSDEAKHAAEAMRELNEDQQRVLTLAVHYGLTHQQIAESTGMPLGTVKTHARRGLIKVREAIQDRRKQATIETSGEIVE
jgi:RNA polymerase sigma-70 factor (ECF subfamily)